MDLNENYGRILSGLGITQWAKDKKLTKEA
jgi:hypothetical protein